MSRRKSLGTPRPSRRLGISAADIVTRCRAHLYTSPKGPRAAHATISQGLALPFRTKYAQVHARCATPSHSRLNGPRGTDSMTQRVAGSAYWRYGHSRWGRRQGSRVPARASRTARCIDRPVPSVDRAAGRRHSNGYASPHPSRSFVDASFMLATPLAMTERTARTSATSGSPISPTRSTRASG
jgi:hypothetical protein